MIFIRFDLTFTFVTVLVSFTYAFKPRSLISSTKTAQGRLMSMTADYSGYALLFDCDGVIVETEEMHRVAYNSAFTKYGLKLPSGKQVEWSKEYYDILQNTVTAIRDESL